MINDLIPLVTSELALLPMILEIDSLKISIPALTTWYNDIREDCAKR